MHTRSLAVEAQYCLLFPLLLILLWRLGRKPVFWIVLGCPSPAFWPRNTAIATYRRQFLSGAVPGLGTAGQIALRASPKERRGSQTEFGAGRRCRDDGPHRSLLRTHARDVPRHRAAAGKYLFDRTHISLDGAAFFATRLDAMDWFAPCAEPPFHGRETLDAPPGAV